MKPAATVNETEAHAATQPAEWTRRAERGSLFGLRLMRFLSLRLGRRLTRPLLHPITVYFLLTSGAARRASRRYLAQALGCEPAAWQLYRHLLTFATTVHDRVYLLNDRFDLFDITVRGDGLLQAWHEQPGHGSLLFGAHLGSFEALRALTRCHVTMPVVGAMYPDNARRINDSLAAINPAAVHEIIALGRIDSILQVHERLREGAAVGILADRSVNEDASQRLPFMGREAAFPTGPFRLAAVLRAPIFFMSGVYRGERNGRGCYEVTFEKIADALPKGVRVDRQARVRQMVERYVDVLERHSRAAPYNWFNFYDFWSD